MRYIVLLGRIFFSLIFLETIINHFSQNAIGYAASQGVPFASFLVPASAIIAFLGALSIVLGYKARAGAWLITAFLLPVTLLMHQFWAITDPMAAQNQYVAFMKNISMLGGALIIAYFGSGPLSLDAKIRRIRHEVSSERVKSYPSVGSTPTDKSRQPKDKKINF